MTRRRAKGATKSHTLASAKISHRLPFCRSSNLFFDRLDRATKARASPDGSRRPQLNRHSGLANIMSFDQPIGAPFTLASLSRPIGSTNGHVHASGVCSISGIKKRKRTEIAVGVDGEGVSIYSVGTFLLRHGICAQLFSSSKILNSSLPMRYRRAQPSRPPHTRSIARAPRRLRHNALPTFP